VSGSEERTVFDWRETKVVEEGVFLGHNDVDCGTPPPLRTNDGSLVLYLDENEFRESPSL